MSPKELMKKIITDRGVNGPLDANDAFLLSTWFIEQGVFSKAQIESLTQQLSQEHELYLAVKERAQNAEKEIERLSLGWCATCYPNRKEYESRAEKAEAERDALAAQMEKMRRALEVIFIWGASVKKLEEAEGLDAVLLLCNAVLKSISAASQEKP